MINIMGAERFLETSGGSGSGSLYVTVGYLVFSLSNFCWQSGRKVETEIMMGTTKTNFLLPVKRSSYIYGLSLSVILSTGSVSLLQFFIVSVLAKASIRDIIISLLLLILSTVYFLGISLFVSSVSLIYKRVGDLANILTFMMQAVTGLLLPIRSLPGIMQYICYLCPTTWAIDSVRSSLLGLTPLLPLWIEVIILVTAVVVVHGLGQYLLFASERKMQREGLLDIY